VGLPTWRPDGSVAAVSNVTRICDSSPVTVPVTLGPLPAGTCGNLTVLSIATLNPLSPSTPGMLAATPLTVAAKCADGQSPAALPLAVAEKPKVEVQEVYTWTASLTHDAPQGFSISQSKPQKVTFTAKTQRSAVKRSLNIAGSVTVSAPAEGAKTEVASATVGGAWRFGGRGVRGSRRGFGGGRSLEGLAGFFRHSILKGICYWRLAARRHGATRAAASPPL
jgi:hypothetical protein